MLGRPGYNAKTTAQINPSENTSAAIPITEAGRHASRMKYLCALYVFVYERRAWCDEVQRGILLCPMTM
jgi:hypothetical protein